MTEASTEEINKLHSPEWPSHFYDVAIAFGQGPTLEILTKLKAQDVSLDPELETEINTWGRTTAVAMGYLALKNQYREAVWSGGKTGGEAFPSEAQQMQKTMRDVVGTELIPEKYDHPESGSTDTLENFVHSLNMMHELTQKAQQEGGSRPFDRMVFVCSDFHATRIKMMASLFNIHDVDVLSSEQIVKIMVTDPTLDEAILEKAADVLIGQRDTSIPARVAIGTWMDQRIDPLNVGLNRTKQGDFQSFVGGGNKIEDYEKGFTPFEKAADTYLGTPESITYTKRMQNEDMFIEGLATIPANWLGFIADIQDNFRFQRIIANILEIDNKFFKPLGIDPHASISEIREKLLPYKKEDRKFVSLEHNTYNKKDTPREVDSLLRHRRWRQRLKKTL